MRNKTIKIPATILFLLCVFSIKAQVSNSIKGVITDRETKETLIGAAVIIDGTNLGTESDANGNFELSGLKAGSYILNISYIGYLKQSVKVTVQGDINLDIALQPGKRQLKEITVVTTVKKNTETALLAQQRSSLVQQTGVSEQQIKKAQDKDASEVIRRIPGISIIEDKFVMVRGLSQRYNNVWINRGAVPSSEPDSRAFSFDIIPASQLDNIIVVKSPAPEYPADFTGGFIQINTKDVPSQNTFNIALGSGINSRTHFKDSYYSQGSTTDFLGFDSGKRSLQGGIRATLNPIAGDGIDLLTNGFNNDWSVKTHKPIGDFSLNSNLSHKWEYASGNILSLLAALNYSNTYKTYLNMENSLFGAYDVTHDRPAYLRHSTDNQYNHNVRIGMMANLTYVPQDGNSRYEFKNIFNQYGNDRYTTRQGVSAQGDQEASAEYYYSSRSTYNGQVTASYSLPSDSKIDWSAGYAYSNRNLPDRRRYLIDDVMETGKLGLSNANNINREFTKLNEHIFSLTANYSRKMCFGNFISTLKAGIYGEYRTRRYDTRQFIYNWNASANSLPSGFRYFDIPNRLLQDKYYGADALYLLEEVRWSNDYKGRDAQAAGYVSALMPLGKLDVYAGVRYEFNRMELISNVKDYIESPKSTFYTYNDFFPSINSIYKLDNRNQLRLSYGRTTNRPEFREVSPMVFYDFDLVSNVQGNYSLKAAYIDNLDFTYSFYPSAGELLSVSAFYKHFKNPIEWTYTVNGGTDLTYSNINARAANNYGVEAEMRKNLDFIGLKSFSINFNGALIKSRVSFPASAKEKDRPMQGQSPYLINTGIFYHNERGGWNAALLYNRIGKRIVGVGRSLGLTGNEGKVPDSYEMPRNAIDLSLSKRFCKHWEVKASARDLLDEKVSYIQFEDTGNGKIKEVSRQYHPGSNYSVNLSYQF